MMGENAKSPERGQIVKVLRVVLKKLVDVINKQ